MEFYSGLTKRNTWFGIDCMYMYIQYLPTASFTVNISFFGEKKTSMDIHIYKCTRNHCLNVRIPVRAKNLLSAVNEFSDTINRRLIESSASYTIQRCHFSAITCEIIILTCLIFMSSCLIFMLTCQNIMLTCHVVIC